MGHTRRPRRIDLATAIDAPKFTELNFKPVQQLQQTLLSLPLGVVQSRASVVKWHNATIDALHQMSDWTYGQPLGFSFFTDGSSAFLAEQRSSAAAVVLIVHTSEGDQFGGFRCVNAGDGHYAPRAEMTAVCVALIWALQLLEAHASAGGVPTIALCFDCTAAGFTASGDWQIRAHCELRHGIRSLVHWIEARHRTRCTW